MQTSQNQIIPVLAAIISNAQNEILIAQRKPGLGNAGKWEFPGGKIKIGESPETGLKREIMEEMGAEIEVICPYHIVNHAIDQRSILLLAYLAVLRDEIKYMNDHSDIQWVKIPQLLTFDLAEADIPVAQRLIKDGI